MRTSVFSLLALVALTATLALPRTASAAPVLKLHAEGFTAPTALVELPDGSGRLLLADQVGTIHVIKKDGKVRGDLFLDVTSKLAKLNQGFDERGLLGLALHPKFADNGKFYAHLSLPKNDSTPADWDHRTRVSEFKADPKAARGDLTSERMLPELDQPFFNHNGGDMAFGPDGFLHIASDGGGDRLFRAGSVA